MMFKANILKLTPEARMKTTQNKLAADNRMLVNMNVVSLQLSFSFCRLITVFFAKCGRQCHLALMMSRLQAMMRQLAVLTMVVLVANYFRL